jgi:C-terminal processing protease CtpA/Prc
VQERNSTAAYDSYGNDRRDGFVLNRIDSYKYKLEPAFNIVDLRKGSPAEQCGLMVGDLLLSINGTPTQNLKLQKIIGYFQADFGKTMRVTIERYDKIMRFQFQLEDPFKQEKLP